MYEGTLGFTSEDDDVFLTWHTRLRAWERVNQCGPPRPRGRPAFVALYLDDSLTGKARSRNLAHPILS